jgi:hypothetical protein
VSGGGVDTTAPPTVAALYVETNGVYFNLPGVDPWDEARDARLYAGPWPVVAHPPCEAWSIFAPVREKKHGLPRGEDGGCFAAALAAVRRWGGVLEHPAYSRAWATFGLSRPASSGAWSQTLDGEWFGEVNQTAYGHRMNKPTWLLYCGSEPPMPLRAEHPYGIRFHAAWGKDRRRSTSPEAFRDVLLSMARTAGRVAA